MADPTTMPIGDLDRMLQSQPTALYANKYSNSCNEFYFNAVIKNGDLARADVYLRCGASPNPKTVLWKNQKGWKNDWFPILWAVMSGKLEMVELLLQYGADVNAKGGISEKVMLTASSWTFDCRRAHTALRAAVELQSVQIVQKLLSVGACPESYQHHYGSAKSRESRNLAIFCDMPVLYDAVKHGNLEIAELLLRKGAKANLPKSYKLNYSYLTEAVRLESPQMVALLLQHGADANFQVSRLGTTPLILAAKASKNAIPMVKLLIQHGANVKAHELIHKKQDALTVAVLKKDLELVGLLLKLGAQADSLESAPLSAAATVDAPTQASVDIVNLLIDWGAPVNGCDPNGVEPLFAAVHHRNTAIVEALLKRGAKADVVHGDMTPLKQAVLLDQLELIRLLMSHGASATARVFAPTVISRGREICCSAQELANECGASRLVISCLQGDWTREPEPTPAGQEDETKPLLPLASEAHDSAMDSLRLIALCDDLMVTPQGVAHAEVMRTVSRAVLCITWALCHHPGRNLFCEWELVAAELDTVTAVGTSYQPIRREPMAGGVVIARGRTASSPGSNSRASTNGGTVVADWHSDGFKLSTGVTLADSLNVKALAMTQGSQRCLRSCELRFKVKTEGGLLGGSKLVGEAWFQLSHLEVGASPGATATFLLQLDLKKKRTGTLAFELTY